MLKYNNNPRNFARANIEAFIPAAVHALIEIMSRPNTPESQRQLIYNAVMERVNDPDIDMMAKTAGDMPQFEQTVLYKSDQEKPKPIILNTPKIDFNFDNKKGVVMNNFKQYRRTQIAEMRPYIEGEQLHDVSISKPDLEAGSPKVGDMIARNPKNHVDVWLVAAKYFSDNFEEI